MAMDNCRERFFSETVIQMGFNTNKEEIVMDVGCGTGRTTIEKILPLFPRLKKLYAIDSRSSVIECAKIHNSDPRIEYITASIEDWSIVQRWEGKITKLLSVHCFNFLTDQKLGFENVFRLLQCGGKAALIFYLPASSFHEVMEAAIDSKWKDFLQCAYDQVPAYQNNVRSKGYKKVLKELGFDILHMKEFPLPDSFSTKEIYESFLTLVSGLVSQIPEEKREEFKNDLFDSNLQMQGTNKEWMSRHRPAILELVLQKN